jgi:ABC-2 type transport system ATP-binding protein
MDTIILANELSVIRTGTPILNEINLEIPAGKITGLIGPSGCGKTTLMRSIVGSQRITSGSLKVNGKSAGSVELRGQIGYMSQSPAVYFDLTIRENLAYFSQLLGVDRQTVDNVIKQVELEKFESRTPRALSGGQISRLSLAIALLNNPNLFILDEPTVGLDPVLRSSLWKIFREMSSAGKSFLISSHVMEEAERCDELILMREGWLLFHGSPNLLLSETKSKSIEEAILSLIERGRE